MKLPRTALLFLLLLAAISAGCASQRTVIAVPLPLAVGSNASSNGQPVVINTVIDKRVFSSAPSTSNMPSLDAAEDGGRAFEKRAIGRKRNLYGQLQGDVLLADKQDVALLIRAAIHQALLAKGYQVVDNSDARAQEGYVVDIIITNYWSWMTPGLWSTTLTSEIATEVKFTANPAAPQNSDSTPVADGHSQHIKVRVNDQVTTVGQNGWLQLVQHSLRAYIAAATAQLQPGNH